MGEVQRGGWEPTIRPSNLEHVILFIIPFFITITIIFSIITIIIMGEVQSGGWEPTIRPSNLDRVRDKCHSSPFIPILFIIIIISSIITIIVMGEVQGVGGYLIA